MSQIRALVATCLVALALPAVAQAQQPGYDETQNWLNSYGRTVDHFSAPNRTIGNAVSSATRVLAMYDELGRVPDRSAQQTGAWPWNGDIDRGGYNDMGDWKGTKIEFEFPNDRGQQIAATLWAPNDAMLDALDMKAPLPGLVYAGGVISAQPMYYWFAQEMARAGYMVLTHDVSGQGRSEGGSTGNNTQDLRNALDFFVSTPKKPYADGTYNPLWRSLDHDLIGTAGHSLGAGAVQSVGDHCGVVKAISAHSDLRATYAAPAAAPAACGAPRKLVPIQGQGADYESFVLPTTPSPGANPEGKLAGFKAVAATGTDVQEIVIESGSHMAWSHVTWAYTAAWSEQVAQHYALAWFDRYLMKDVERDGASGTERLKQVFKADAAGHGVSKKYRSAWSIGKDRCDDMVAAGPGC